MDRTRREIALWDAPAPWDWGHPWPGLLRRLWEMGPMAAWDVSYPAVDLYEKGDAVIVEAELPGVDPDDVDVEISDHHLVIRGQVRRSEERHEGGVYRQERRFGAFVRTIPLPEDVDVDRASASFRRGILELRLPKKEGRRRRLAIKREG